MYDAFLRNVLGESQSQPVGVQSGILN